MLVTFFDDSEITSPVLVCALHSDSLQTHYSTRNRQGPILQIIVRKIGAYARGLQEILKAQDTP